MFLTLAALALLCVIATQDWLVPPLRNSTISAGLTGPYHVMLDAAYVVLAAALVLGAPLAHFTVPMEVVACVAALCLLMVAATNTAWRFFDLLTDEGHAKLHSLFTIAVFSFALLLQVLGDHGWRWGFTVLNLALPGALYGWLLWRQPDIEGTIVAASPAAEKLFTLGLCLWLAVWAL